MVFVVEMYQLDVFDQALFPFAEQRLIRYWEGDGFLWFGYRRIEKGRLQRHKNTSEVKKLNNWQLQRLLARFSIEKKKKIHLSIKGVTYLSRINRLFHAIYPTYQYL